MMIRAECGPSADPAAGGLPLPAPNLGSAREGRSRGKCEEMDVLTSESLRRYEIWISILRFQRHARASALICFRYSGPPFGRVQRSTIDFRRVLSIP